MLKPAFFVALALLVPVTAHADQCALNAYDVADRAAALIKRSGRVLEYCASCGDTAPGRSFLVNSVASNRGHVSVNGSDVDLAYLYVETGTNEFRNVGLMTRCGARQVAEFIRNGTPTAPTSSYSPPRPPPVVRATGPDDLAGTWSVSISTRISSCPAVKADTPPTKTSWSIQNVDGSIVVATSSNELVGSNVPKTPTFMAYTLQPKLRPEHAILRLTQFAKDSFSATLVRAETAGTRSRDPVCVIQQDVFGRRAP